MTKKILFLHNEMIIGGIESVLINYLDICVGFVGFNMNILPTTSPTPT